MATFRPSPIVKEVQYPPGVLVDRTLRVWSQSRWRGPFEFARIFLSAGYAHLSRDAAALFNLHERRDSAGTLTLLTVTFTNPLDAQMLLGEVFWCGCESIFFIVYNMFTNTEAIFPTRNHVHNLPYPEGRGQGGRMAA